ncbi:MAG: SpoIIE family protein phosphatase [Bacteroidales bacterium]|nr:SpoIIE family protein phosphatase [Bacteroidales bacterium]
MDSSKRNRIARVGFVVLAAVLIEAISITQYQRVRSIIEEDMAVQSKVVLSAMVSDVDHMLETTEHTMNENLWIVRRYLDNPDSAFAALTYLIDDNPQVAAGFLAYVPDYFPSKGRLFEPCALRRDGAIVHSQLGGPEHDYTLSEFYQKPASELKPSWSNPYPDAPEYYANTITYSYPILDAKGRLAAVCGLDMNLSWLGDTLNSHQPYPSSFGMLLTQDGLLVAGPPESRTAPDKVEKMLEILRIGATRTEDKKLAIQTSNMLRAPYWQVVEVYSTDEAFSRILKMRRQSWLLVLIALGILFFMIERYTRGEKKLSEASAEKARLSGELEVARNIQEEMLPKVFPDNIFGTVKPALEVGGDLFDFYRRDGKLFFCIGDVSGKGVPAAMLMSVIHSLFRIVSRSEDRPSFILKTLNEQICERNSANLFVTFFVGCIDLYTSKFYFANAGHDKPFVLSESAELLPVKANLPLGVFPDTVFEEQSIMLTPGQSLFLYTDGLTEAKNKARVNFGRTRLKECIDKAIADSAAVPQTLISRVGAAVSAYSHGVTQSDDLTMLVINYAPGKILSDKITITNDLSEVRRLNEFVKGFLEQLDVPVREASHLRLALEESVVNSISYAYPKGLKGEITVYADSDFKEVRFTVVDSGVAFDPTAVLSPDTTLEANERPIGGLGILLTRKLVDSVSYCRKHGNNVLSLTKILI